MNKTDKHNLTHTADMRCPTSVVPVHTNPLQDISTDILEKRLESVYRVLSNDFESSITFGANREGSASPHAKTVRLPRPNAEQLEMLCAYRGEADFLAFRSQYHDTISHAQNRPTDTGQALLYNALEDARIEACGSLKFAGASANINQALYNKYERLNIDQNAKHMGDNGWAEALKLFARTAFMDKAPPENAQKLADIFAHKLTPELQNALSQLGDNLYDQQKFAGMVNRLIDALNGNGDMTDLDADTDSQNADDMEATDATNDDSTANNDDTITEDDETVENTDITTDSAENAENPQSTENKQADTENTDTEYEGDGDPLDSQHNFTDKAIDNCYKPYTEKYDVVEHATDVATDMELYELRTKLDTYLESYRSLVSRVANRLQRKLQAQQLRAWHFDLDEGLLDTAKLTRVVTNPLQSLSFKQEKSAVFKDTVVTLLIDNSGSMRGRPIALAAMATDILARTLERCGVKVEVLGFTTTNWKGGKSYKDWDENGRKPKSPGRLNDLRHIIYKSATAPYTRTKNNFGLMLKEGLLKENIDGEALQWAYNRLLKRTEDRRILMVISDGAPVDDATLSNNTVDILERHLRNIIYEIENTSDIELLAVGIGHDVTQYYTQAVTLPNADSLATIMMGEFINLFDDKQK